MCEHQGAHKKYLRNKIETEVSSVARWLPKELGRPLLSVKWHCRSIICQKLCWVQISGEDRFPNVMAFSLGQDLPPVKFSPKSIQTFLNYVALKRIKYWIIKSTLFFKDILFVLQHLMFVHVQLVLKSTNDGLNDLFTHRPAHEMEALLINCRETLCCLSWISDRGSNPTTCVKHRVKLKSVVFTVCFIIVPQSVVSISAFTPASTEKLTFLELCQVQITIYALSLYTALTASWGEGGIKSAETREVSWASCFHRQVGSKRQFNTDKIYLIYCSANRTEAWKSVLMWECTKLQI